jgi:aromatic ring-cleaving dioxygenase
METAMFSRGGMCANPFGGEDRIDRINLMEFLGPNAPPEKVLYARVIQDAASNYLYAFLGKNGTSAEEFFAAHQYFFKVVSTDVETWNHHRTIKQSFTRRGKKVIESRYLKDSELKLMCFDKHYDFSGLGDYVHIDRFRDKLKSRRRSILSKPENWEQVKAYVQALYQHELSMITDGNQVPLQVWNEDLLDILVDPPTPLHLASAIFVPTKAKRPKRSRAPKPIGISPGIKVAEKLANLPPMSADWGPLSTLFNGASNAEVVRNIGSDNVCSNSAGHSATT